MPRSPKKPCGYPGCPKLTDGSYCDEHQKAVDKHYNKYDRDPESNKRYGRTWKRVRDKFIKAHPLCEECKRADKLTPAEEVHHILPLSCGGTNDVKNLIALCKACHSRITLEATKNNREQ